MYVQYTKEGSSSLTDPVQLPEGGHYPVLLTSVLLVASLQLEIRQVLKQFWI